MTVRLDDTTLGSHVECLVSQEGHSKSHYQIAFAKHSHPKIA